jgi:hypothetical protein
MYTMHGYVALLSLDAISSSAVIKAPWLQQQKALAPDFLLLLTPPLTFEENIQIRKVGNE